MDWDLLLFSLTGGLVYADTDAAGQFAISQPLIACTLAGWLLGNMAVGLTVGILLQLPYLIETPAGGTKVSVGRLGAYVAAGVAANVVLLNPHRINSVLFIALLYGTFWSWGLVPLQNWLRRVNLLLLRKADTAAGKGQLGRITMLNYLGLVNAYVFGVFFSASLFLFGRNVCELFLGRVPIQIEPTLELLKPVLLGVGLGALFWHFLQRKTLKFMVLGALLSAIFVLIKFIK